jgi:head-tail adaptor
MFKHGLGAVVGVVIAASLITGPANATEEVIVDGTVWARAAAAQRAEFQASMAEYARAMESTFNAAIEAELRESASPRLRLASIDTNRRG